LADCAVGTKLSYFVAGIGIGAVVALLFAPQSGEKTRKQIVDKAQDGKDFVASKGREIRKQAEDIVDQGMDLMNKQKSRLADAFESGKQAARETFAR
jgi:gas vesicle protein